MKKFIFLCLLLCLLCLPNDSEALSMFSTSSLSFASGFGFVGVTPFDPTLGTLEEIAINIEGSFTGTATVSPAAVDSFGQVHPVPYTFEISQTFDGSLDKYFDFVSPATFLFAGDNVDPVPTLPFISSFSYGFKFDASTDLLGGNTFPSFTGDLVPPTSIFGFRDGFLETSVPIDEILFRTYYSIGGGTIQTFGNLTIEYLYEPNPVPEPSTFILLFGGFMGLVFVTRRRKKE